MATTQSVQSSVTALLPKSDKKDKIASDTNSLLLELVKHNKKQIALLKELVGDGEKSSKTKKLNLDKLDLNNRSFGEDLKEFTKGFFEEFVSYGKYMTGLNKKSSSPNTKESPSEPIDVKKEQLVSKSLKPETNEEPKKEEPTKLENIEKIYEKPKTDLPTQLIQPSNAIFNTILQEVRLMRKIVEGSLKINFSKRGPKYMEFNKKSGQYKFISEDKLLNSKVDTDKPKNIFASGLEPENKNQKEDAYIEKLSTAIAEKLADLLDDSTSFGKPNINIADVPEADRRTPKENAPKRPPNVPRGPDGKTPPVESETPKTPVPETIPEGPDKKPSKVPSGMGRVLGRLGMLGIGIGAAMEIPEFIENFKKWWEGPKSGGWEEAKAQEIPKQENLDNLGPAQTSKSGLTLNQTSTENTDLKQDTKSEVANKTLSSTNIIDNSQNQIMAMSPGVRNTNNSWVSHLQGNMVGVRV